MKKLYTILFYLLLPLVFLRLLWRSRRLPGYRKQLAERLGFCPHHLKDCIWVHAVSVGETIAAIPLIKSLQKQYPNSPILVTNMTPTGAARVKAAFGNSVFQAFIPYDLPAFIERFLARVNPSISIIMETELWPNLFAACKNRQIPVVVLNARLSEKSAKGYQWIPVQHRHELFSAISYLAAQAPYDAERFIALGMPKEKIVITGNLKFDLQLPDNLMSQRDSLHALLGQDRFIWIAASTHPGEEEIILEAHREIQAANPSALLILVPRHPDRFDSVASVIEQKGLTVKRRSHNDACSPDTAVYLGDTMGELLLMYSVADVAFVAGSFATIGGHNMLEPAALQKPILTGPQLFNFAEISQLLIDAKGMRVVTDAKMLAAEIIGLYQDQQERHEMGENAYQVVLKNRGSLLRQMNLVQQAL